MKFFDKKSGILFKNENGGKVMARVSLPRCEENDRFNLLYSFLSEKYFDAAREFINKRNDTQGYFFDVSYFCEEGDKYIKIKRISTLKSGKNTLWVKEYNDIFEKESLKLKK